MAESQLFRNYLFSQTPNQSNIELARAPDEVVCLAFDVDNDRFVQFHILVHAVEDPDVFADTVEAVQTVESQAVARLIEAGCDDDSWFYITEHVDGEPLDTYLDRVRQLQGPTAASIAHGLLEAIVQVGQGSGMPLRFDFKDFRVVRKGDRLMPVLTRFPLHATDDPASGQRPFHVSKSEFERDAQPLRELLRTACRGRDRSARMKSGWVRSVELRRILELLIEGNQRLHLSELASLRDDLQRFTGVPGDDDYFSDSEPTSLIGSYIGDARTAQRLAGSEYRLRPMPRNQMRSFAFAAEEKGGGDEVTIQLLPSSSLCGHKVAERVREVVSHFNSKDHPHVVRVLSFHETDPEGVWYAETTPPGRPLNQLLAAEGPLSPGQTHELLVKLQFALREANHGGVRAPRVALQDIYVDEPLEMDELEPGDPIPETFFGPVTVRLHPTSTRLLSGGKAQRQGPTPPNEDWVIQLGMRLMGLDPAIDQGRLKRKGLPEPLIKLVEAVWARAPHSAVSNRIEFLERFGRAVEDPRGSVARSATGRKAAAIGRKISGLAPINLVGKSSGDSASVDTPPNTPPKNLPPAAGDETEVPVVHPAPIPGFLNPETGEMEGDEPAPGFAEVLLMRNSQDEEEDEDNYDEPSFAHLGGSSTMSPDARRYLRRRSFSHYAFLFAVILIIAAAVAASLSHFGGNAIWQRPSASPEVPAGSPSTAGTEPAGAPDDSIDDGVPEPTEIDPGLATTDRPGQSAVTLPPPVAPDLAPGIEGTGDDDPPAADEPEIVRAVPVDPATGAVLPADDSPPVPAELTDLHAAATAGSAEAQSELGVRLRNLQPEQSRGWLRTAADQMDADAMVVLAEMLQRGEGGPRDDVEAYRMLARAANQGAFEAYVPLARVFLDGRGVDRQPEVAVEYLRASAVRNDPTANLMLAQIYEQGQLAQADIQEAAVWYRRAAELGHSVAQEWCRQNGIPFSPISPTPAP